MKWKSILLIVLSLVFIFSFLLMESKLNIFEESLGKVHSESNMTNDMSDEFLLNIFYDDIITAVREQSGLEMKGVGLIDVEISKPTNKTNTTHFIYFTLIPSVEKEGTREQLKPVRIKFSLTPRGNKHHLGKDFNVELIDYQNIKM